MPLLTALALLASMKIGVNSLVFSPDGKHLVYGTESGMVRVTDETGAKVVAEVLPRVSIHSVAISSGGDFIAAAGGENAAFVWRFKAAALQPMWQAKLIGGDGSGAAFAYGGKRVAFTTLPADHAFIFDTGNGQLLQTLQVLGNGMEGVAWLPDGKTLVTGGQCLMVWDLSKPGPLRHPREPKGALAIYPDIIGWTRSLSVDRAGKYVLAAGSASDEDEGKPRSVVLVDPKKGKVTRTFTKAGEVILAVAISPDGRIAAASDEQGAVRVWRVETGDLIKTLRPKDEYLRGLAFSPDGKRLATAGVLGNIEIWNL